MNTITNNCINTIYKLNNIVETRNIKSINGIQFGSYFLEYILEGKQIKDYCSYMIDIVENNIKLKSCNNSSLFMFYTMLFLNNVNVKYKIKCCYKNKIPYIFNFIKYIYFRKQLKLIKNVLQINKSNSFIAQTENIKELIFSMEKEI